MKKRYDPLWEIVGEKVSLQGEEAARDIACPRCRVILGVSPDVAVGTVFCCGLCGATCRVIDSASAGRLTAEEVGKRA